jgi:aspartate/methionine/tyrosine aminotransferase
LQKGGLTVASNPNNPTGTVIPRDILEQVLALAQKNNIVVFSDEVLALSFIRRTKPLL